MILKFVMRDTDDVIVEGTPTVTADGTPLTPTGTSALWSVDAPLGTYVVAMLAGAVMREWQMPNVDGSTLSTFDPETDAVVASNMVAAAPSAAVNATAVRAELAPELAHLDADVSGANTVAPDNASIASILEDTGTTLPALIGAAVPVVDGMTITQATLGTDGLALGQVMPNGTITAYLDDVAKYQFDADADGDFSYVLPWGSIWTLIARAPQYRPTIAEVSTVPPIS